jgi:hypothetical protein
VEESQVARALQNIRDEVIEFEKEGILRGTLSAADQGCFCLTFFIHFFTLLRT